MPPVQTPPLENEELKKALESLLFITDHPLSLADLGAQMVREVASKTSDVAGDGTTTATVLAQAIVREGMKNVTPLAQVPVVHVQVREFPQPSVVCPQKVAGHGFGAQHEPSSLLQRADGAAQLPHGSVAQPIP